jgi:S1-C subfamily serine protease
MAASLQDKRYSPMVPALLLVCFFSWVATGFNLLPISTHRPRQFLSTSTTNLQDTASGLFWPATPGLNGDAQEEDNEDCDEDDFSAVFDSIIKIYCTHSEPDYLIPWQRLHQTTSTSSGFVIAVSEGERRIMTNAHSVEYHSIVQVQRRGGSEKYEAIVEAVGQECDLALLKVDNPAFWEGLGGENVLEFGNLPELQDEVEVLGYPTGGDSMSVTSGVVSRIEMQEYVQAGMHLLSIQIDAAINPGNSGGPVIDEEGQVVGVAFQTLESGENIGYVVPVTVVQHFLEDIRRHGHYTGFCSMGARLAHLENGAFRKSLGMKTHQSGIVINDMAPMSACKSLLQKFDVIVAADGIPVANDGKIPFRPGERVSLVCYIQTKFVGDSINLKILRDGKELEVEAPVSMLAAIVRAHWNSQPPPYLIASGLVFTALSVPFLNAADAWDHFVSDEISYLLGHVRKPLEKENDEIVVLCQVLAHRSNLGYDQLSDLHLTKFNGETVQSLRHLSDLLKDCKETFMRFEFEPGGHVVVMERDSLEKVTSEVCEEHSIQNPFLLLDSHIKNAHEDAPVNQEGP